MDAIPSPLSALISECAALVGKVAPRLAEIERRVRDLEQAALPEPQPEPEPPAPPVAVPQTAINACWQTNYAVLHQQLRDNGIMPAKWQLTETLIAMGVTNEIARKG